MVQVTRIPKCVCELGRRDKAGKGVTQICKMKHFYCKYAMVCRFNLYSH